MSQMFSDVYGWRGALLLIAGVNMHSLVCGAMLRPHQSVKDPIRDKKLDSKLEESEQEHKESLFYSRLYDMYDGAGCVLLFELSFMAQVLVPAFLNGYMLSGWMIYIVSFATSKGATLTEASIVSTCGGIGYVLIKTTLPLLHYGMSYKQLLYAGSCTLSASFVLLGLMDSVIGMSLASVIFGFSAGVIGSELYTAIKVITEDIGCPNHYTNGCSWFHMSHGIGSIVSGVITGRLEICIIFTKKIYYVFKQNWG